MRLLPKKRIEPDSFALICETHDWIFHERMENPDNREARYSWLNQDATVRITYVYDPILNLTYIVTDHSGYANEPGSMRDVNDKLRLAIQELSAHEALNLLDRCETDAACQVKILHLIAASAPEEYDESFFQRFTAVFRNEQADVRSMALIATLYMPWPQILPVIESLRESDASIDVRNLAQSILRDHPMNAR
ncbi:hypothetical protein [Streptomyces sp. RTGN2]|uniref:hypothetical protein n=1 Tax=unclassified Streptomyces TaxID=2593676 RepID=UPI0025534C33|nr:hypothetical protein [Streptomyces sp. RTGN2]WSU63198.1 hypothetical protein OG450_37440 [Streptomyces sp. NBC_01104]